MASAQDYHACEMSTLEQKARGTFLGGTRRLCGVGRSVEINQSSKIGFCFTIQSEDPKIKQIPIFYRVAKSGKRYPLFYHKNI